MQAGPKKEVGSIGSPEKSLKSKRDSSITLDYRLQEGCVRALHEQNANTTHNDTVHVPTMQGKFFSHPPRTTWHAGPHQAVPSSY